MMEIAGIPKGSNGRQEKASTRTMLEFDRVYRQPAAAGYFFAIACKAARMISSVARPWLSTARTMRLASCGL